jgi:hypothetical protein
MGTMKKSKKGRNCHVEGFQTHHCRFAGDYYDDLLLVRLMRDWPFRIEEEV